MSEIRYATDADVAAIWSILEPVFRGGETYMIARDITREAALAYWLDARHETFIAVEGEQVLGTYYLRANQGGGGAHVANCGYITAPAAQGRGIARAMLNHSLERARQHKHTRGRAVAGQRLRDRRHAAGRVLPPGGWLRGRAGHVSTAVRRGLRVRPRCYAAAAE
jgi:GNAT superfamily N-acetyltransferase